MATTADEMTYSEITRITGRDETRTAEVIQRTDGKDALVVDSNIGGSFPPGLNNKYRFDWSETEVEYAGPSYALMYQYTGTGYLHGFHVDTDTDKMQLKLVIDNETIFEGFTAKLLSDLNFKSNGHKTLQSRGGPTTSDNSDIDISPHADIRFSQHVRIYIKRSDGANVKMKKYIVFITKNT